jgi:hypothetical protein
MCGLLNKKGVRYVDSLITGMKYQSSSQKVSEAFSLDEPFAQATSSQHQLVWNSLESIRDIIKEIVSIHRGLSTVASVVGVFPKESTRHTLQRVLRCLPAGGNGACRQIRQHLVR